MTSATIQATQAQHDTSHSTYWAQPYEGSYLGYGSETQEEYDRKVESLRKQGCDEWELSYLDGEHGALFNAAGVCQGNINDWLELLDTLDDWQEPALYFLLDHHGYSLAEALSLIDDVMVFEGTAEEYTTDIMDETGQLESLPETLRYYFDYAALARDMLLNGEIHEVSYRGTDYIVSGV